MSAESIPLHRYRELVDHWPTFLAALERPLPRCVAPNAARIDSAHLATLLEPAMARVEPLAWSPGAYRLAAEDRPGLHWGYAAGLYTIQEEASLLPVRLLAAQPGERVLDLCAAPGNKSAQVAVALGDHGTLVANDISVDRISALHDITRRLGLVNVTTTARDGATWPEADASYDRVLVDAPCTAEGNVRKGIRRGASERFRRWVAGQQRALLTRALELCRPGGRVVYATCTFAPEENEAILDAALQRFEGNVSVVPASLPGLDAAAGIEHWQGHTFDPRVRDAVRLWPHQSGTGGFFAAVLQRAGEAPRRSSSKPFAPRTALTRAAAASYVTRFDLSASALEGLRFFQTARHVRAVTANHRPPAAITAVNTGLEFARLRSSHPKITTAAALALGRYAGRNHLALDSHELARWRRREEVRLPLHRLEGCEHGYLLITHAGFTVGTGFLRIDAEAGRLESHFPKAWTQHR